MDHSSKFVCSGFESGKGKEMNLCTDTVLL